MTEGCFAGSEATSLSVDLVLTVTSAHADSATACTEPTRNVGHLAGACAFIPAANSWRTIRDEHAAHRDSIRASLYILTSRTWSYVVTSYKPNSIQWFRAQPGISVGMLGCRDVACCLCVSYESSRGWVKGSWHHQKDLLLCTVRAAGTHLPITASVNLKRYKFRSQTKCNTAGLNMDQCNAMLHHVAHTRHAPGPAGGSSLGGGQAKGALCARMTHHRVKLNNSHALALEDTPTCTGRVHYALSWILAQTSSHSAIVNRSR